VDWKLEHAATIGPTALYAAHFAVMGLVVVEGAAGAVELPASDRSINAAADQHRPTLVLGQQERPDCARMGVGLVERAGGAVESPAPDRPIRVAAADKQWPTVILSQDKRAYAVPMDVVERAWAAVEPPTSDRPIMAAADKQRMIVKLGQHKPNDAAPMGFVVIEQTGGAIEPYAPDRPITTPADEQRRNLGPRAGRA
jgi:hypothetical protein